MSSINSAYFHVEFGQNRSQCLLVHRLNIHILTLFHKIFPEYHYCLFCCLLRGLRVFVLQNLIIFFIFKICESLHTRAGPRGCRFADLWAVFVDNLTIKISHAAPARALRHTQANGTRIQCTPVSAHTHTHTHTHRHSRQRSSANFTC